MRVGVVAVLVLSLAAGAEGEDLFRCGPAVGGPGRADLPFEKDWKLVPIKHADFRRAFGKIRARRLTAFDPKYGIESVTAFVAMQPIEEFENNVLDLLVGLEVRRGGSVQHLQVLGRDDGLPRVMNESPGESPPPRKPRLSQPAGDRIPILRLDFHSHSMGAHGEAETDATMVIDLRLPASRLVVFGCDEGWVGGACAAPDFAMSPWESVRCRWSDTLADFVCTTFRVMDTDRGEIRGVRRHELLSNRSLPAFEPSLASIDEMAAHADKATVMIDNLGALEWILTADTPGGELRFFALPSSTHRMMVRLFAVHPGGRMESVLVKDLTSPDEAPMAFDDVGADVGFDLRTNTRRVEKRYTLASLKHVFSARRTAVRGAVKVYEVVLTEGRRRALFWIGVDSFGGRPRIDALRVASTSAEYGRCNEFIRPLSASSTTWRSGTAVADLIVEPYYTEYWTDERLMPVRTDCALPATVTWSGENGFAVAIGERCVRPAQSVAIDERGAVQAVPRLFNEAARK